MSTFLKADKGIKLIEVHSPRKNEWAIRWNVQPDLTEHEGENGETYVCETAITCQQEIVNKKPTLEDVKTVITNWYNEKTDEKILNGFIWEKNGVEYNVWLSTENQFNYKSAYDLAVQTNGASLPVTFKFGNNNDVKYFTFETLEDISDFYMKALGYIQSTLNSGWVEKDTFDYTPYESYV